MTGAIDSRTAAAERTALVKAKVRFSDMPHFLGAPETPADDGLACPACDHGGVQFVTTRRGPNSWSVCDPKDADVFECPACQAGGDVVSFAMLALGLMNRLRALTRLEAWIAARVGEGEGGYGRNARS